MLTKQFRERMSLMPSRDAFNMVHHGIIEDYPVSARDLKGKETRRSPEEVKLEHVALGLRTELVLHVNIMFVRGLILFICLDAPLGLLTCIFLVDGRGKSSVKLATAALLSALCECNFELISL